MRWQGEFKINFLVTRLRIIEYPPAIPSLSRHIQWEFMASLLIQSASDLYYNKAAELYGNRCLSCLHPSQHSIIVLVAHASIYWRFFTGQTSSRLIFNPHTLASDVNALSHQRSPWCLIDMLSYFLPETDYIIHASMRIRCFSLNLGVRFLDRLIGPFRQIPTHNLVIAYIVSDIGS